MVFKRPARNTYEAQLLMRSGDFRQVSLRTSSKAVATHREVMWNELAREHQAWDILERVLARTLRIDRLHDLWKASRFNIHELRRRLTDADVAALVDEWHAIYLRSGVTADTAAHALLHVRAFFPAGKPMLASACTVGWLTERLYGYRDRHGRLPKPGTLRKVHSNVAQFFDYLTRVKGLYPANPMHAVEPPGVTKAPIRFYEREAVDRIVGWQPTEQRRVAMALAYGCAIEATPLTDLTRADFAPATKELRMAGTKAHTRDRVGRIAEWAWPIIWDYVRTLLPAARLFPAGLTRFTVSDWHRQAVTALGLPPYPLHHARHHWAVRALRAGVPVAVVQQQLGHGTAKLTLDTYGAFVPTGSDRDHWEHQAAAHEARRQEAK